MRRSPGGPLDNRSVTPSLRDTLLLRERALQATTVSVVITDVRLPDNPIVWVNAGFTRTTGYLADEAIGRNPRFLQGPETDPTVIAEMRRSIAEVRPSMVTLVNYRADGSTFWNSVSTAPVFDDPDSTGGVIGFIGIQVDVTDSVLAQREREERLRTEHTGRISAEKAQRTLSLLAEVNDQLVSTFDLDKAMHALVHLLVPRFADGCAVDLVSDAGTAADPRPVRVASAAVDADAEVGDPALLGRVLRTSRPVTVQDPEDPDGQSLLVVPLMGHDGVLGALTLVSAGPSNSDDERLQVALDIGRRAGFSVEWCRLYERERRVTALLQKS
ncbi:MAG TPA: PAS domain-containing protein [Frankiaceae bacterium]|nr:PAS domain-containing protein [Frankiaceae bacterium]